MGSKICCFQITVVRRGKQDSDGEGDKTGRNTGNSYSNDPTTSPSNRSAEVSASSVQKLLDEGEFVDPVIGKVGIGGMGRG